VIPLEYLPNNSPRTKGIDVASVLGIGKYEPIIMTSMGGDCLPSHPKFPNYTNIEHLANYPKVLRDGEIVSITEKIHGCLQVKSRIMLPDETSRTIKEIVDDPTITHVMGVDQEHNLVSSLILNRFNNGETNKWLQVKLYKHGLGRSNRYNIDKAYIKVVCTENHLFYTTKHNSYTPCKELKQGDKILYYRIDLPIGNVNRGLMVQTIMGVEEYHPRDKDNNKYDLETKTHNFFANGVLVHNSNIKIGMIDGTLMVGSHKTNKKEDQTNLYWKAARQINGIEALIPEGYVLYGEVYGWVQNLRYGYTQGKFSVRFFDLMIDGVFQDYDIFRDFCKARNLSCVPELYRGGWDQTLEDQFAEGQSTIADHIREGCVIKPVIERYNDQCGRIILKHVNKKYLSKKHSGDPIAH